MKVILGLGNPGPRYTGTRHNIGYRVVTRLAERWDIPLSDRKALFAGGRGRVADTDSYLAINQTFMNLSGQAVGALANKMARQAANLIVIHDDIDMPPGRVRLKGQGGDGGHRGVRAIIQNLGNREFFRIKVGVGIPDRALVEVSDFVLQRFPPEDKPAIDAGIERAADAVELLLREGLTAAQGRIHPQS